MILITTQKKTHVIMKLNHRNDNQVDINLNIQSHVMFIYDGSKKGLVSTSLKDRIVDKNHKHI